MPDKEVSSVGECGQHLGNHRCFAHLARGDDGAILRMALNGEVQRVCEQRKNPAFFTIQLEIDKSMCWCVIPTATRTGTGVIH